MTVPALELAGVQVRTPQKVLLHPVDWRVAPSEHWVVLGPNGAGKTTLLSVCGARRQPSEGTCSVLGRRLGRTDIRDLWTLVGMVDASLAPRFAERLTAADVVLTGAAGTTLLLRDRHGPADRERAAELIELLGCAHLAGQRFRTCSAGERQRILIARALMPSPALLLLDEPSTGLDLVSREALLGAIEELAGVHRALATVTVTHHVEEIPSSATHALLLAGGRVVAQGALDGVMTGTHLSRCFGIPVEVTRHGGRFAARAQRREAA
jgi:iron complex transport system ATP-binding protein